ncbi:MAG: glycosyl transferase [Alphaproteobacteria bacterium]|nr:glycosyl transferase [Alphaproteobacteria bacterium]
MKIFSKKVEENKTIYKLLGIKFIFKNHKSKIQKLWTEPIDEKFRKINYLNDDKLTTADKKRMIQSRFYNELGYYPNIDNPKTLNEKIQWLKLYYDNPLITIGCDKYRVKEYISKTIGDEYVVKLLGVYDDADEINFDKLPEKFALKVNDNTGFNIIVNKKEDLNIPVTRCRLNNWVQPWKNCYYASFYLGYKNVVPKIIAEEYLDIPNNSKEYKIFCFNGKADFVLIELDYFGADPKRAFYDRNFKETEFKFGKMPKVSLNEKPKNFDKMIQLADKLAAPFPFVRVDFYDINGKIYFGELTFYSGGGFSHISPKEWDEKLGNKLQLPINGD